ncbi:MAG: tetraacyldisaccharide 4'-kinase [Thermoguttaceae bacterium]|nr:tetraacyldisaccharide 4'-kinase [Thermoguttaceae bacterium]MBR6480735.1 tetraacyldisaccharide 4'-kinase [Thermoguttaceae bacterium]
MDFRELVKKRRGLYGALHLFLSGCALLYAPIVRFRNFLYDAGLKKTYRLGVPVVSVGNLTMGGTGKTPVSAALLRAALARGIRPALLSRGYLASNYAGPEGKTDPFRRQNDEAAELALDFPDVPHYQDSDRVRAGRALLADFPETNLIILDDGFQHRRLARDVNLVLIDALDPFGGGLFPAGMAREPLGALRRADGVILTRADLVEEPERRRIEALVRRYAPDVLWGEAAVRPTSLLRRTPNGWESAPFSLLKEEKEKIWVPFCGIGNPDGFFRMLRAEGVRTAPGIAFPDHTAPGVKGVRRLAACRPEAAGYLTTVKDLVKLPEGDVAGRPVWGVKTELNFLSGESFFNKALGWE